MRIVIPAHQRDRNEDLNLLIESITTYTTYVPSVFYTGASSTMQFNSSADYTQQRLANKHFGDACRQIVEETSDDSLLFVNDDCVFTPHTLEFLEQDIALLKKDQLKVGLVGLRTNFSAGWQNIRRRLPSDPEQLSGIFWPSELQVCQVPVVFGTAFYVERSALQNISDDWTRIQWYGDNLLSWDLSQKGYMHFVSRSYIHHHGSRSGTDYARYDSEAKAWLKKNRKDFYETMA